jgi:hypothetical protein
MANIAVCLIINHSTNTVADEIVLSRIPYIDYSSSSQTPRFHKHSKSVALRTTVRILVQTSCFFGSQTESGTDENDMAGCQHVSKSGRRRMYASGHGNHAAGNARDIFTNNSNA